MTTTDNVSDNLHPPPPPPPQLALVRRSPWDQLHELAGFLQDLDAIATALCKSTLLPPSMQAPANLKLVLAQGLEMGFTPIQAIRASFVVESKKNGARVGYYVESLVALVRKSNVCRYFTVEVATADACRVRCARADEPEDIVHRFELTMDAAKKANLDKEWEQGPNGERVAKQKYTWFTAPADMLRNRCCGRAVKTVFQDVVYGMTTPDEIEDLRAAEVLERDSGNASGFAAVPMSTPAPTAQPEIVDAEIVEPEPTAPATGQPAPSEEGTGDPAWDAAVAEIAKLAAIAMPAWTPADVLEEFSARLARATTKAEMNPLGSWIAALKKHGEKAPTVLAECAKFVAAFNARTGELRKAGGK